MTCDKRDLEFSWAYVSLDFRATTGAGTCIAMQTPRYLTFDSTLNPDSVNKQFDESFTLIDALAFSLILRTYFSDDTITLVEDAAFTMRKGFADTITLVEQFTPITQWTRNLDETVRLVEVMAKTFRPAEMIEGITLTETFAIKYTLRFAETIHLSETFSNGKNQNLADTFQLVEHGMLNTQDYFDTHTYFAGDYFGTSRTW